MAVVGVTHAKVVTVPDDGTSPVGSDEWNAGHVITGLENVDNTSDASKPVSTAQAAAIAAGVAGVTKTSIGLGNVDNTSDVNKPVSTAQAAAIAASTATVTKTSIGLGNVDNTSDATKNAAVATLTNKTLTAPAISSPTGIVKGDVGLGNVDNTSDANKPVSTAQAAANAVVAANAANASNLTSGTLPAARIAFAAKADQVAASSTTLPVNPAVQQNHPSGAKAWVHFTGSTVNGAQTINASYNVASVSRTAQGLYIITFTTGFTTAFYACSGSEVAGATNGWTQFSSLATGSVAMNFLTAPIAGYDPGSAMAVFFGTQ